MLYKLVYSKTVLKDNRLNFDNKVIDSHFFPSSMPLYPYYTLKSKNDSTLVFESRFESGNLLAAFKLGCYSYELLLSNDTNTSGFNKWFFFRVSNMRKGQKYNLAIINNGRQNKQYSNGIKIFTYSVQKNQRQKIGWHHSGEDVSLIPNEIYQFTNNKRVCFNTLSFNYCCEYDDDTIYFANCIPYTYTKLMNELKAHKGNELPFYHQDTLCKSLGGNDLEYFRIDSGNSDNINSPKEKEGIVLFARQHPSETVGSWVMKGVIDLLVGDSEEAKYIRDNFEVLVIPMVNIDGVIAGNSRTSYSGCDINRKWTQPKKHKHPEVYFIKELIRQFANKRKVMCLVDFHGHLSAFNSFFYSNYDENDINKTRAFPYACARSSSAINFDQCVFSMTKYKQGSSRINLCTEFGIENACTLETSGFGFDKGKYAYQYINESNLQEIGRDVCLGIVTYHYYKSELIDISIPQSPALKSKIQLVVNELKEGKMNIQQEDFSDKSNCNSEDEGNINTAGEPNSQFNEDIEEDFSVKLKSVRLKRLKIQLTNCNMMITPDAKLTPLNLNSINSNKTIIKSKSNIVLPVNKYQTPLSSSSLNEALFPSEQSNINQFSEKTRIKYKTGLSVKEKKYQYPNLQKRPQLFIPSLHHVNSGLLQGKNKSILDLITLPPYPAKKLYSTRDAYTQTESIFFDSKVIYFIGSYKILKYKYIKEKIEQSRNRFNIMKSLTFKDHYDDNTKSNKESKSTQTRPNNLKVNRFNQQRN